MYEDKDLTIYASYVIEMIVQCVEYWRMTFD